MISQVVLAPLAALLVANFGFSWPFWINAASYVVSAIVLGQLSLPSSPRSTGGTHWFSDVRQGLSAVIDHRILRALAVGQLLAALSAGATSALLVVLTEEHLGLSAASYGFLLTAIGVGAAVGPLVLARVTDNPRQSAYVFGPFVLRGLVDAILATVSGLGAAMAALFVYGVGTSSGAVTFNSLLQAETPERLRGRIFATFDMLWQTGRLLSLVLGGVTADAFGIRTVYYLGAVLLVAAATIDWLGLRPPQRPAA